MRNDLVVIIDSGIDTMNTVLMTHVEGGCNFLYQNGEIQINDDINDSHGHGTNCADLLYHLNDNIHFYIIKIVDKEGLSYSELMLKALQKCLEIPAHVICMSLSVTTKTCDCMEEMHKACRLLNQQGKIVCISENNDMEHSEPARFDQVIGVKAFYGGKKNTWRINEQDDIQVVADGNPIFLMGKNGGFNFFKGCSKANAFFSAIAYQYLQKESIVDMKKVLEIMKLNCEEVNEKEDEEEECELGIGKEPETEQDIMLENVINNTISEISGLNPSIEALRKLPIMCQITGISYFNFYDFISSLCCKLEIEFGDFHKLEANDICTLYRLRQFLKEYLNDEKEKQGIRTSGTV